MVSSNTEYIMYNYSFVLYIGCLQSMGIPLLNSIWFKQSLQPFNIFSYYTLVNSVLFKHFPYFHGYTLCTCIKRGGAECLKIRNSALFSRKILFISVKLRINPYNWRHCSNSFCSDRSFLSKDLWLQQLSGQLRASAHYIFLVNYCNSLYIILL